MQLHLYWPHLSRVSDLLPEDIYMKAISIVVLIACIVSIVHANARLKVYEADGTTLFDGREIMVGTRLTFIVSSDSGGYWSGGLFIEGQNRAFGALTARDPDPNSRDWAGSHYEEAGDEAGVFPWNDSAIWGFDLYTSDIATAGDWFILDYEAIGAGDPNVGFYDYGISWDEPNSFVSFIQVPSRDFNDDEIVNLLDYAVLSSNWLAEDCNDPFWCGKADIDADGDVDTDDLMDFAEYWLWDTVSYGRSSESYPEACPEDPNITYSVVDPGGLDEITINIGDSITLYVDMETSGRSLHNFFIEVNISDPNLGSIDNTPYDPNDPPGLGTARILANPDRWSMFDRWGPGLSQYEGIHLGGLGISAFDDGHLASFVFTCQAPGDVTLELIKWESYGTDGKSLCPTLESLTIHQVDLYSQQAMGDSMSPMLQTQEYEVTEQMSGDEMAEWLETIWIEDNLSETISQEEWNEFIESVKSSY
ncbi:MAG: hypothetical protein KAR47_05165 [Planctomycetes bacterium]|nr:hypothetical protein [Planctomycetota bacterium]